MLVGKAVCLALSLSTILPTQDHQSSPGSKAWISTGPPGSWLQSYGHIHSDCRVGIYFEQTRSSQSLALPLISQTRELISYLANRDNTVDFIGLLWRLSELIHKVFRLPSKHSINANYYYIFFFITITAIYWITLCPKTFPGPVKFTQLFLGFFLSTQGFFHPVVVLESLGWRGLGEVGKSYAHL